MVTGSAWRKSNLRQLKLSLGRYLAILAIVALGIGFFAGLKAAQPSMLRTGEGAGVDGVIMSRGTVDIYNPKTIRSTMGSLYRVPFAYVEELADAIRLLQKNDIPVYAAHLRGERFFDELSYEGGSAFLIGNEGNGLKKETADLADLYLKIPMEGKLESLNASVAAALLLYQAAGSTGRFTLGQEK